MTYFASSCFNSTNIKDLLRFCREKKFYQLELNGNLEPESELAARLTIAKDFTFLIHNYFPAPREPFVLNLASADKNIRQMSIDHCRQALSLCQQLNIPFYSVHAGFLADLQPNDLGRKQSDLPFIDRDAGLKYFTNSITQLLNDKVDVLIENNINSHENLVNGQNRLYLLAEPEETYQFFSKINDPRLGLLVDLGHLNVSSQQLHFDKYQFLDKLPHWIKAFHLSANDGESDQGLSFSADEWFIKPLKQFPKAVKIIEIDNNNSTETLSACIKIIDSL